MQEALAERPFETCAAQMSRKSGSRVISKRDLTINGHPAIKAMTHAKNGDWLIRVYSHKAAEIIMNAFIILQNEYQANANAG